jgi:flagellar biosynthesis anti-sigma factor FlgM
MKIDANSPVVIQLPIDQVAKRVLNHGLTGTQGELEDRTTFHTDIPSVQALTSQAMNFPEIRQSKVDSLRQAVGSGTYQVNSTKTAEAMIESEAV